MGDGWQVTSKDGIKGTCSLLPALGACEYCNGAPCIDWHEGDTMAGGEEFETNRLRRDLLAQRGRIDEISRRLFAVEDGLDKPKTEEACLEELISIGNGMAYHCWDKEPSLVQQWDAAREAFQRYGREHQEEE